MIYIFVLFMNGYAIDVDSFTNNSLCQDKVRMYQNAFKQSESKALVWCEQRPRA